VVVLGAGWVALFTLEYMLVLRHSAADPYLQYSFSETFLDPLAPRFAERVSIAVQGLSTAYFFAAESVSLLPPKAITASVIMAVIGLGGVARRNGRWAAALLAGPVAAAVVASAVSRYPILPRTMLFSAPLLVMMLVAGAHSLVSLLPQRMASISFAAAGALLVLPTAYASTRQAALPSYPYDIKSAISELRRQRRPGEPVFLSYNARAGWAFYTTDWAAPDTARIAWLERSHHRRVAGEPNAPPSVGPVDPFVRRNRAGTEIVERLPDGVMWVEAIPSVNNANEQPLESWAKEEAERVRAHANPTVWVLYQGSPARFLSALLDGIHKAGATVDTWQQYSGVRLLRVRFGPDVLPN
jgi:hypothetical protein